jgi:signal transduction histidine kinase
VTPELARGLAGQEAVRVRELMALAGQPAVTRYLIAGGDSLRERALAALAAHAADRDRATVELWSAAGEKLLSAPAAASAYPIEPERLARSAGPSGPGTGAAIGPLLREGDRTVIAAVAWLRDGEDLLGYLTDRRAITASPEAMRAMTDLVGEDSRLLIGNVAGDGWTDLMGAPVAGPPVDVLAADGVVEYTRNDTAVIARAMAVAGTPWLLLIELAHGPVFASASRFLDRGLLLTLLLTVAGALVAYAMSRRMSLPLRRVTDAAESLAAGHDVAAVPVTRADEIGRLAASFNAMAEEVRRSHQLLEQRVAERTTALQDANRELESFSYSVSHDLRAPLRAVDGFAAILEEDHGRELSSDARRYLVRIRTSAQQMGALIDDLLAFSRLGRQPVSRSQVDLEDLARTVVEEACRLERRDPAEVALGSLPPVLGERSMIRQVFVNLVQNALKFTRDRRSAGIAIGSSVLDGETIYYVQDDGVGFDMRYADKLFGVFQRLHPAEEFEGTGVGLAVVKRVVERHGGRVWAESAPDAGATFYFTIPPEAASADVARESEEAAWK